MRTYILFFSILIFSFFSKNSYSQNAMIEVKSNTHVNVEEIFDLIRAHTNYQFIYKYNLIKNAPKVTINKGIIKVKDLLKKGLDGIECTYDFDDDQTIVVRKKKSSVKTSKTISGRVTHSGKPVPDVNILIRGKYKGTKTDDKGYYKIKAQVGDIIRYSHVGYSPVAIILEDVSKILNIEMEDYVNTLDEVNLTAKIKSKTESTYNNNKHDKKLKTALGNINPMLLDGTRYFPSNRIQKQYRTLSDALKFYYPKGIPVEFYDVDGVLYNMEPFVDVSTIKDIYLYPGGQSMSFPDPVMFIRTTNSPENRERIAEENRNQNFYKNDAITITKNETIYSENTNTANTLRTIKGKITHLIAPLPDVNIKVKGRTRGTKSNRKGNYELQAKTGEIIQFSYIGFKSVSLIVEDITKEINIDMITEVNELDEVVVTVKTIEGKTLQRSKKADKAFSSSRGSFDPKTSSYSIGFIEGNEVSNLYGSIKEALIGKIAGYSVDGISGKAYLRGKNLSLTQDYPVAWEVDGVFTTDEPVGLDLSQIENVYALKSLAATNKYGTLGAGGVIVIITKLGNFNPNNNEKLKIADKYTNKNYYNNDAKSFNIDGSNSNTYTDRLETINDVQEAYAYYNNELKFTIDDVHVDISIAKKFIQHYKNRNLGIQVLKDATKKYRSHPEYLKAIAYQLQLFRARGEAVKVYQEIYKLRPKYAQSYRDLANAYHENDQYKKSWRLYMSYLLQGHDATNEGIGSIVYNEMEYLYFNRQYQTKIKEKFIPKNETLEDFRNDVRMVFEWNTSEAEFDLEFVSPDKRSYVFEHSLNANEKLIIDEKTKGYSSKEFIIEAVGNGEWLVNINYNGNKKPEPTYFKVTTYYQWGKTNQRKKTQVFKFKNQRDKIQLAKINKQSLLTSK